jgi:DNA-binding transcriptional MerR regulator
MPKDFLTSGEFASLRNVNLNSLRYYEKMNLLKPAWIDLETKYRYYRLEQLSSLDTILFFIEVGMPLRTLKDYIDQDGNLDQRRVLRDSKKAMNEKISSMNAKLATTEFYLMNLEQNRWCNEQEGIFTREIGERFFIVAPFHGEWKEPLRREKEAMRLFHKAQDAGMLPTFPAGILVNLEREPVAYSFFVQVLRPSSSEQQIRHISKGVFSCMQTELTRELDIPEFIRKHFGLYNGKPVILHYILRDTHHFASRYIEIQVVGEK